MAFPGTICGTLVCLLQTSAKSSREGIELSKGTPAEGEKAVQNTEEDLCTGL